MFSSDVEVVDGCCGYKLVAANNSRNAGGST